jgi:asparagine synthase (glutamine-hydrolysing)
MCGISGLFDTQGRRSFDPALAQRINDVQAHRGPDEADLYFEPGLMLGHRRLSVIDLATGQQPLFNAMASRASSSMARSTTTSLDAPSCSAAGMCSAPRATPRSSCRPGRPGGEECVHRLRGMFAFAIWDRNRQTLFMARDRMGVKPLHYACCPMARCCSARS